MEYLNTSIMYLKFSMNKRNESRDFGNGFRFKSKAVLLYGHEPIIEATKVISL